MLLLISLFIIGSAALISWAVAESLKYKEVKLKLVPAEEQTKKIKVGSLLSKVFPFTQILLEKLNLEEKLKHKVDAAHVNMAAADFLNAKLLFMLICAVFATLVLGKFDFLLLLIALAFGYMLPDIWLLRKINQRKRTIARVLPETVDLLSLCVEAGLDFTTAVRWIIEKVPPNPLIEELSFVLEEIKWGKPRTQALKDMSKRMNIPEVVSFVQVLVQAERMGTPVNEAFTILSEDSRLQRFHRGERFAMRAPIKILIPLVFCILPVIGIIIGGPILLQFMQGNMFKGF